MTIINNSAYFVFASVVLHNHTLYPTEYLLYTKAQPNSFSKSFLPEQWTVHRQASEIVHFCFASRDSIDVVGKTDLHVCTGDFLSKTIFPFVNLLAVNFLLRTIFFNENIRGILLQPKKVVPCNSKAVSVLGPKQRLQIETLWWQPLLKQDEYGLPAFKTQVAMTVAKQNG